MQDMDPLILRARALQERIRHWKRDHRGPFYGDADELVIDLARMKLKEEE